MKALFLLGIIFGFSLNVQFAMAQNCPIGQVLRAQEGAPLEFQWSLGSMDTRAPSKKCRVLNPEALQRRGARVLGCSGGQYILEPLDYIATDCYSFQPERLTLAASSFQAPRDDLPVKDQSRLQPGRTTLSGDGMLTPEERKAATRQAYLDGDQIGNLVGDIQHENTNVKPLKEIDKYHLCLLSENRYVRNGQEVDLEKKQRTAYQESFRRMISFANSRFGVPHALLACTCGRESRFDSQLKDKGGATGACQATGPFLEAVNSFIKKDPKTRAEWTSYLDAVKLESPDCRKTPITKELILKCPALGVGSAALYLRYIMGRLEGKKEPLSEADWEKQSLSTYVAVSGAFNLGVTFADDELANVNDRSQWDRVLLTRTCKAWLINSTDPAVRAEQVKRAENKFNEVRGHLIALRNCMQKGSLLNHQGKPMGGACAVDKEEGARQLQDLERYKSRLPSRCESQHVISTPSGESSRATGATQ